MKSRRVADIVGPGPEGDKYYIGWFESATPTIYHFDPDELEWELITIYKEGT